MSRNWIDRGEQMRYSGRYPINEMWNTRQALMNDLRRNLTLNKYLTSIERKCSDFVFEKRNSRSNYSNWKQSAPCTVGKDTTDKVLEDKSRERRGEPEDSSGYFNDDPNVDISLDVENETSTAKPINAEFIIKEEPSSENFAINTEYSEFNINLPGNLQKNQADQIESQTEESNLFQIQNLSIEVKSEENYETEQTINTKDVEDCVTEENPFDFQEISATKCDENDSGLDKKSESGAKTKNCKEKSITYKDFVRSVSKLVSDSESSKSEKIQHSDKNCGKLKKTKKMKSPNSKKDSDVDKTIRSTRSSIKCKKVHNVEKKRTKKEEEKKVRNKTEVIAITNTLKQNKQKTKSKSRYSTRSQRKEKESEEESVYEEPSASRSKQKEYHKRKIVYPADEDIPLAKYTKLLHHNEETKVKDSFKGATDFDKAICYSPDSCVHSDNKTEEDINKSKTNQIDKFDSELRDRKMKKESTLQTRLILINDSDSDKQQNTTNQTASRELDCLNNNTDLKQEKSSSQHVDGDETWSSSHENEQLWEYLKCDFCDFMVSKKKEQSYQLMEEHLESTKHNAASIVKISISDGELKPVFVKKEHAILLSLEKATVLPYCPTCFTIMPSIWTVQLHAKYKHSESSNYDKDKYCLGKIDNVVNIPIPRKINVCKKCGLKKNNIQEHWETHNHFPYDLPSSNQIAQFSCSACNRYFDSFSSALSHAVAHEKHDKLQNDGVIITYITKSEQVLTLLPREKTLSNGRALEILNQAKLANKQGQWTRAQRKEFEMMAVDWKRCFKQY
ncbi:titin homolog [Mytilus californianus]|uniref:titin homolog n=1 Tax=Mytilus californianus TaxID=6549 RepID=UPI0022453812|nr:titin homolog [Mytilus californianus]XP_052097807.1 titin homolog [Mytilus californianus]